MRNVVRVRSKRGANRDSAFMSFSCHFYFLTPESNCNEITLIRSPTQPSYIYKLIWVVANMATPATGRLKYPYNKVNKSNSFSYRNTLYIDMFFFPAKTYFFFNVLLVILGSDFMYPRVRVHKLLQLPPNIMDLSSGCGSGEVYPRNPGCESGIQSGLDASPSPYTSHTLRYTRTHLKAMSVEGEPGANLNIWSNMRSGSNQGHLCHATHCIAVYLLELFYFHLKKASSYYLQACNWVNGVQIQEVSQTDS